MLRTKRTESADTPWLAQATLFGAASLAILEIHRQLVIVGLPSSSDLMLFCGYALAALVAVASTRKRKLESAPDASCSERDKMGTAFGTVLVPLLAYAVSLALHLIAPWISAEAAANVLALGSVLMGYGALSLLFAWVRLLAHLEESTALKVFACAWLADSLFYLIIVGLCASLTGLWALVAVIPFLSVVYRSAARSIALRPSATSVAPAPDGTQDSFVGADTADLDPVLGPDKPPSCETKALQIASRKRESGLTTPFMAFLLFLAFSCLFVDGASSVDAASPLSRFLAVVGIALCGLLINVFGSMDLSLRQSPWMAHVCVFLASIFLFLGAYLLSSSVVATLPMYAARSLVLFFVLWGAFSAPRPSNRTARSALCLAAWVGAWFTCFVVARVFDGLGGSSHDTMPVLSLLILMGVAAYVLFGLATQRRAESHQPEAKGQNEEPSSPAPRESDQERFAQLARDYELTAREAELLPYLAAGLSADYIAEVFTLSPATVRTHAHNIYRKVGVSSQRKLSETLSPL